jgi:tetratricopeptide (TPR) repeat protein
MKRVLFLIVLSVFVFAGAEDEPAVAVHYKKAILLRDQGDFAAAIEEVSKGIALNPQEKEWLAKSEVLSARLYFQLGMLESAKVTARQVALLYQGTEFETEAKTLQEEISQLTKPSGQAE